MLKKTTVSAGLIAIAFLGSSAAPTAPSSVDPQGVHVHDMTFRTLGLTVEANLTSAMALEFHVLPADGYPVLATPTRLVVKAKGQTIDATVAWPPIPGVPPVVVWMARLIRSLPADLGYEVWGIRSGSTSEELLFGHEVKVY